jgi:pilus assembly protein CpaC
MSGPDRFLRSMPGRLFLPLFFVSGLLVSLGPRALGQQKQSAAEPQAAPQQNLEKASSVQVGRREDVHLLVGRSKQINSQERIKRVSVADPNVLDTQVVSPTQVLIDGKAPGSTSLVLWTETGESETFDVFVDLDIQGLRQMIHQAYPAEKVGVESENGVVVLSGRVASQAVVDKIVEMAKSSAPKTINMMEAPTPIVGEILLQVKFANVDRTAVTELGLNILSLPGAKNIGIIGTQQFGAPQLPTGTPLGATTGGFSLSDLLNIFIFRPDIDLAMTIKALQQKNIVEILAEPNVMTQSGKDASFLAGGEFPYPVVQASSSGAPVVTILFREYGVKLDFTPTLTSDGMIHLKVKPEVSALDFSNALIISGFTIPALTTDRVESEMDLRDGQSFAIAGLLDNRVTDVLEKVPGIGDIPILGKLFQSRSLTKSKNELLVLVTPHIVMPAPPNQVPAVPNYPEPFMKPGDLPKSSDPSAAQPVPGGNSNR